MLLIYTHKITNRVNYIFELFFNSLLGVEYKITTDEDEFLACDGARFSYGSHPLDKELFFASSGLLFERGINNPDLLFIEYNGSPAFYPAPHKDSGMPFDPFSAAFYLVSRYEEYLPYVKDEYNRFSPQNSIAIEKDFLKVPLVNKWAIAVGEILQEKYPDFVIPEKKYSFVPIIDIDAAWAYKSKGFMRSLGSYIKSLAGFGLKAMADRTKVLLGLAKDPLETYDIQLAIQLKYDLSPVYFILFADYGMNDKNISVQNNDFQVLIKSLADYSQVGIHCSYGSSLKSSILQNEVERLSRVLNREITKTRQHFQRLNLPGTYRNFIDQGITEDYSMGYLSVPGFRAGICAPFYFYDLDMDAATNLVIHPFAFAETASQDTSPGQRLAAVKEVIQEARAVNGTLIGSWDNESLSSHNKKESWQLHYEKIIKLALGK